MLIEKIDIGGKEVFRLSRPFEKADFSQPFFYERNRTYGERETQFYKKKNVSTEIVIPLNFIIPDELLSSMGRFAIGYSHNLRNLKMEWESNMCIITFDNIERLFDVRLQGVRSTEGYYKKLGKVIDEFLDNDFPSFVTPAKVAEVILDRISAYNQDIELELVAAEKELFDSEKLKSHEIIEEYTKQAGLISGKISELERQKSVILNSINDEKKSALKRFFGNSSVSYSCKEHLGNLEVISFYDTPDGVIKNYFKKFNNYKFYIGNLK